MSDASDPKHTVDAQNVEAMHGQRRHRVADAEATVTLLDAPAPESLREILEAPVVADFVEFLRESTAKQTDLAKRQADRAFELQKQQLELQAAQAEREHQIEKKQIELAAAHGRWARWVVVGMLAGLAALFVGFRDKPEVAIDVAKGLAALGGAVGIGWSLRKAPQKHGD